MEPLVEPPPDDRVAVLVVRAWPDDVSPDGFRARLIEVRDITTAAETTTVVDTVEALQIAVRQLVERLQHPETSPAAPDR